MGRSDIGLMLANRGVELDWSQARVTALLTEWRAEDRLHLRQIVPDYTRWLDLCFLQYHQPHKRAGLVGALKAPLSWPIKCRDAWGLDCPPRPWSVLTAFMRPVQHNLEGPLIPPASVAPLDWALWRAWLWGYDIYEMHRTVGLAVTVVVDRMAGVIRALMEHRLDVVCWALNPDYATIPEGRLSAGWYKRNERWIRVQAAIGRPYVPGPPGRRAWSNKERTWPENQALVVWARNPRKKLDGMPLLWPGSQEKGPPQHRRGVPIGTSVGKRVLKNSLNEAIY